MHAKTDRKKTSAKKQTLVQQAYEQIKENIILLRFLPGQYLNEASICESLGLGRTPVHQALQLLQLEGLIEVLPRKGIIVQPDGANEILKILEARRIVEPPLAEKAAQRIGSGELEKFEIDVLLQIANEPDGAADPADIDAFISNDRRFHCLIGELSGNAILSEFAKTLHERSCRFWYLNIWQTLNVEVSKNMHIDIANAISAADEKKASDSMMAHIDNLTERLKKLPPNAFGIAGARRM